MIFDRRSISVVRMTTRNLVLEFCFESTSYDNRPRVKRVEIPDAAFPIDVRTHRLIADALAANTPAAGEHRGTAVLHEDVPARERGSAIGIWDAINGRWFVSRHWTFGGVPSTLPSNVTRFGVVTPLGYDSEPDAVFRSQDDADAPIVDAILAAGAALLDAPTTSNDSDFEGGGGDFGGGGASGSWGDE